ncbi:MAG: 1-deoxy-D-xylulose-5-phosphate synthase [Clostridia bacterium]|nr:1-deoxy-D-xylulose-5-phosphate synthase [Clostridia bacterium]
MKLANLQKPAQLRNCSETELMALAQEIRRCIIDTVNQNGGHLASNLGAVEMTLALHSVFECPRDKILFDVGHQCYTHKLLTGRYEKFAALRRTDGLSGFPSRAESEYDAFADGHASTAISAAAGLARARDLQGENFRVVAVVGDGAMTGGMCYEALNDVGQRKTPLILILNDNEMSIDRNVGALSLHLTKLRTSRGWLGMKKAVHDGLEKMPLLGKGMQKVFRRVKNSIRNVFVKDRFFSSLGFRYFGPIDGHDLEEMRRVFMQVRDMNEPVVVHVVTQKGRGYQPAEEKPELFHGVSPKGQVCRPSFGTCAGEYVAELAGKNEKICVVTAAMTDSTGFKSFRLQYPHRLFDVGIAEEHAVTLAAGLAAGGMRPVVAIYQTFLQRGWDQMLMDVCLQKLPVLFLADRSGLGADDGPTHHGVFALPMLMSMPGMTVFAPVSCSEMKQMIDTALQLDGPAVILYPRSEAEQIPDISSFESDHWQMVKEGKDAALITFSSMVETAMEAAERMKKQGVQLAVVNASCLWPMDEKMLRSLSDVPCYTLEESVLSGGFGSHVAQACLRMGIPAPRLQMGIPDVFVPFGDRKELLRRLGLDADSIARTILEDLKQ